MAQDQDRDRGQGEFLEKLVKLNRVAKVVKGGRRFSFSALTVVGDRAGRVGYGFGKANDVSDAIRKSIEKAKRSMVLVPIKKATLPHQVIGKFKSAQVLLKPAAPGTGVIAGGPVRAVMEAAGIHDVLSKSLGSSNAINTVKAVFQGLGSLMDPRVIAANRGRGHQGHVGVGHGRNNTPHQACSKHHCLPSSPSAHRRGPGAASYRRGGGEGSLAGSARHGPLRLPSARGRGD